MTDVTIEVVGSPVVNIDLAGPDTVLSAAARVGAEGFRDEAEVFRDEAEAAAAVATATIRIITSDEYLLAVQVNDYVIWGVKHDGTVTSDAALTATLQPQLLQVVATEEYTYAVIVNDYVVAGIATDGTVIGASVDLTARVEAVEADIVEIHAALPEITAAERAGPRAFRSVHAGYGQSNRNATGAFPRRSTAALTSGPGLSRIKFPNTGRFVTLATATMASVTDAIETAESGETGMRVSGEMYADRLEDERGLTLDQLGVDVVAYSAAKGGAEISWLVPGYTAGDGNQYFENLVRGFSDLWDLDNDTVCQVLTMIWGESAYDPIASAATIKAGLSNILDTFDTRVKAINGQTAPVVMYLSQVAAHEYYGVATPHVALAQAEWAAEDRQRRVLVSPMYPFEYNPTAGSPSDIGVHLSVDGVQRYACLEGDAIATVQSGKQWICPRIVGQTYGGDTLTLEVEAEYDMVIDTSYVTDPGSSGFGGFNSADAAKTITSVTVVAGKFIKIKASTDWVAGDRWTYAWTGRVGGTDTSYPLGHEGGSRGCLRDDRPGTYTTASGHSFPKGRYLEISGGTLA